MSNIGIFREYDVRGVAETDLPDAQVELLGRAVGTYIIRHSGRKVLIARDSNAESSRLHASFTQGLRACGAAVMDAGIVPKPVLNFAERHFDGDGSVMIVGSDRAPDSYSFKISTEGEPLYGDQIKSLHALISGADFDAGEGTVSQIDAITPYVEELGNQFAFERALNVIVDCSSETVAPVIRRVVERLRFQMNALGPDHDGGAARRTNPADTASLKHLQQRVRKESADLGVAFDSDGDRIGIVDERGHFLPGDILLLIFGREILSRKPGSAFVADVQCSQVLFDELRKLGGKAIIYKTGISPIRAKMKEEHAELAGELSGHIFFGDRYYGYDDAIYAACRLIEIIARSGQPLSHQLEVLPKVFSTPELRAKCPDEIKFQVVSKTAELARKRHEIIDVDGARVSFEHGWGLVRASNTQPALVMRFEATTKTLAEQYQREMEELIEQAKQLLA